MLQNLFDNIKEVLRDIFKSRLIVLAAVMVLLAVILIQRLFSLQIIHGEEYQKNYTLKIKKEKVLTSTRGNIYDRDGNLLAYNELANAITIEDNGTYKNLKEKNKAINTELQNLLHVLDTNGDKIDGDFDIALNSDGSYSFNVTGNSLYRFLADIYGVSSIKDLKYDKTLKYNLKEATAQQVMDYLCSETHFNLNSQNYSQNDLYRIALIRFAMSENSFQKYISTTICSNASDSSVSYVNENSDSLQGMAIEENTIRKYVDSEYFSHIIGYTGKISESEYNSLSKTDKDYSLTDVVGKAGIEQVMDQQLQGKKGHQTVYVDNLGKIVETTNTVEPTSGNNVYLSIRKDLQEAVYNLLEQEIAGIVYSKIDNIKSYDATSTSSAGDIIIPIYDVYYALINNSVIDSDHFSQPDASATEQAVYSKFVQKQTSVLQMVQNDLSSQHATAYGSESEEMQVYLNYIISMLTSNKILETSKIDTDDSVYKAWKANTISAKDYLTHAIESNWIDVTKISTTQKYSDSSEVYTALLAYIQDELKTDSAFSKKIYKYLIDDDAISGKQLCLILYDQGILKSDEGTQAALSNGSISSYDFLKAKIKDLEITPAQLALDPCSGSCVITDTKTGEVLALVSYPGYDNNRLANTVDAAYYKKLQNDLSLPLYDYATQQSTAPGSTFKLLSSTAGLTEGVISPGEQIDDLGIFTKVSNNPRDWSLPQTFGLVNVSQAIEHSINYFFYEVGYRLSTRSGAYNPKQGIDTLTKYAQMYGLTDKTGIEIPETSPHVATDYPVMAAIGQSDNSFTTSELSRYVTAVANSGTVYNYTLLDKVQDNSGNVIKQYTPTVKNSMTNVSSSTWDAIHQGMQLVVQDKKQFADFPITVAGKTGTAQQIKSRPNHALFVAYAPYDDPQISVTTRIAYGYTSDNAVSVTAKILKYYFGLEDAQTLLNGQAAETSGGANGFND